MHQVPNESIISMKVSTPANNLVVQDLLWISKQQQQHPLTHVHPLKNTIRVNSRGVRCKFDGKQWRPLCQSPDQFECRNLAFRSSLCQKHFYKIHLFRRPYVKNHSIAPLSVKRAILSKYEQQSAKEHDMDEDDPIEIIEHHDTTVNKQENSSFSFFSIDCESTASTNSIMKSEPSTSIHATRRESLPTRSNSIHTESIVSNDSECSSIQLSIPPLTRTEEKSLANELIQQLSIDVSLSTAEHIARQRLCEIVYDNYSCRIPLSNIPMDWFYDFLLHNPRVPVHFQSWFSLVPSALPISDQLMDIKIWQLGLVTRSIRSTM